MRWLAGLMLALVALTGAARGQSPVTKRTDPPAWVENIAADFSAVKKTVEVDGGLNRLLVERQTNVSEATQYRHFANQFVTEPAVRDGSRISISFDPAYESLTLHRLIVHRNGKAMNRLEQQEIKLLQREKGLDRHVYDGRMSAEMIMEDIRVGDVLEYAYSTRGANPIFEGKYIEAFNTQFDEPIHHLRFRLLWPAGRRLQFKAHGKGAPPVITARNGVTEYVWEDRDVPGVTSDGEVPLWFDPWSWVQLSEFESWTEVARWAERIYQTPEAIPEELESEIRKIARLESGEARVLAALRYVQDNIRYLGIAVGENSHRPYSIETILSRRFGDCKDKSRLLCAMLRRLDFEAYPALVATDERLKVTPWLPSPLAFDHMVVQLRYQGKEIWLDPTDRNQGGSLEQLYFPALGQSLVVTPSPTGLTAVRPSGFAESSCEVTEVFDFSNFSGAATLRVRTVYRGNEADEMRSYLADTSLEVIRKRSLNFYAGQYAKIGPVGAPSFHDDRTKNVIVEEEAYQIVGFWKPVEEEQGKMSSTFIAQNTWDWTQLPQTRFRTMPFALRHPRKMKQVIEINLPRDVDFENEHKVIEDVAFRFEYSVIPSGTKLTLHHAYETRADLVPAAATSRYVDNVERMRRLLDYQITLPTSLITSKSLAQRFGATSVMTRAEVSEASVRAGKIFGITLAVGAAVIGAFLWWRARARVTFVEQDSALHRCVVCGATEQSDPSLEFRVASDGSDYCHRHRPPVSPGPIRS